MAVNPEQHDTELSVFRPPRIISDLSSRFVGSFALD
jgi:hypothetical protein